MKTGTDFIKRETSEVQMVNLDSDSDDSVVHVPYTKPAPPTISLDDSDIERETDNDTSKVLNGSTVSSQEEVDGNSPSSSTPAPASTCTTEKTKKNKKNRKNKDKNKTPKNNQQSATSTDAESSTSTGCLSTSMPKNDSSLPKKKNKRKNRDPETPTKLPKKKKKKGDAAALIDNDAIASTATVSRTGTGSRAEVLSGTNVNSIAGLNTSLESVNGTDRTSGVRDNTSNLANDDNFASALSLELEPTVVGQKSTGKAGEGSKKKSAKRKRKKDVDDAAVSAAKEEFTSFLKTLNLSSNIGMNDKDMQMIAALSPADLAGPAAATLNPKKRTKSSARNISSLEIPSTAVATTSLRLDKVVLTDPETSSSSSIAEPKSVESHPRTVAVESTVFKGRISSSSTSTTATTIADNVPDVDGIRKGSLETATPVPAFAFVSVVDETSTKKQKNKSPKVPKVLTNEKAIVQPPPQPQSQSTTKDNELITIDADDSEEEFFTNEELSQVRSNIRLNITGTGGKNELSLLALSSSLSSTSTTSSSSVPVSEKHLNNSKTSSSKPDPTFKPPTAERKRMRYFNYDLNDKGRHSETEEETNRGNVPLDNEASNDVDAHSGDLSDAVLTESSSTTENQSNKIQNQRIRSDGVCYPASWTPEMIAFYGTIRQEDLSMEDVLGTQSDSPRLWRIPIDLQPQRRRGRQFKCTNCNQFGYHTPNRCPEPRRIPKCVMCGHTGHTTNCLYTNNNNSSKNAQRFSITKCFKALCLNCGRNFHNNTNSRDRKFVQACDYCYKNPSTCQCCGVQGHREPDCPDSWRRFHSTTVDYDTSNLQQMVKNGEFAGQLQQTSYRRKYDEYCSNCARKGHNYYHCDQRKDHNAVFIASTPYIVQELPVSFTRSFDPNSATFGPNVAYTDAAGIANDEPSASSLVSGANSRIEPYQDVEECVTVASKNLDNDKISSSSGTKPSRRRNSKSLSESTEDYLKEKQRNRKSDHKAESSSIERKRQSTSSINEDSDIEIIEIVENCESKEIKELKDPALTTPNKGKKNKRKDSCSSLAKCRDFPDCTNTLAVKSVCFKVRISKNENHKALLKLNEKYQLVEKLHQLFADYDVRICLLKKSAEFHLSGRQFYRARDRISRLVKAINSRTDISMLFPELYSQDGSSNVDPNQRSDCDSQVTEKILLTPNSKSKEKNPKNPKSKSSTPSTSDSELSSKRKSDTSLSMTVISNSNRVQKKKDVTPSSKSANLEPERERTPKRKSMKSSPVKLSPLPSAELELAAKLNVVAVTPTPSSPGPNIPTAPVILNPDAKAVQVSTEVNKGTEDLELAKSSADIEVISSSSILSSPPRSTIPKVYSSDSSQPDELIDTAVSRYEFDRKIRKITVQAAKMPQQPNVSNTRETEAAVEIASEGSSSFSQGTTTTLDGESESENATQRVSPKTNTVRDAAVSTCPLIPVTIPPFPMGYQFPPRVIYPEPNPAHDIDERQVPATELQKTSLVSPNSPFAFNPLMNFYSYQQHQLHHQHHQNSTMPFPIFVPKPSETSYFTNDVCANSVVANESSEFIIDMDQ